jgi:L-amino acid N-acyltransferase YncA
MQKPSGMLIETRISSFFLFFCSKLVKKQILSISKAENLRNPRYFHSFGFDKTAKMHLGKVFKLFLADGKSYAK